MIRKYLFIVCLFGCLGTLLYGNGPEAEFRSAFQSKQTPLVIPSFERPGTHYMVSRKPTDITKDIKNIVYFLTAQFIKRALLFSGEEEYANKPPVVLIVVHGTWSKDNPEFTSDNDPTYQGIKKFAEKLCAKHKAPLILFSFGWSGENDDERRKGAAQALVRLLDMYASKEKASLIYGIGHSHGGNVFHYASKYIRRPIDILVNLGTPTREDYPQWNINTCYNLYSTSDPVQIIGSYIREQLYYSFRSKSDPRKQPYRPGKRVVNIHTKVNGVPPGHVTIKDMIAGLFEVLEHAQTRYQIHDDLVANVVLSESHKQPETIVAINKFLTTLDLFSRRAMDIDLTKQAVLDQLRTEVNHSNEQEKKFFDYYNADIRNKGSALSRIVQSAIDLYRIAKAAASDYLAPDKDKEQQVEPHSLGN